MDELDEIRVRLVGVVDIAWLAVLQVVGIKDAPFVVMVHHFHIDPRGARRAFIVHETLVNGFAQEWVRVLLLLSAFDTSLEGEKRLMVCHQTQTECPSAPCCTK